MTIGVYQILNTTNGKRYIGQSVQVEYRLNKHKALLTRNQHENTYLQRSWNKTDPSDFEFNLLIECPRDNLDFYEDLIIKGYESNIKDKGYNLRTVSSSNAGMVTARSKHKPGDKYFRLTFVRPAMILGGFGSWVCLCDCGNEVTVRPNQIIRGHNKSCGCLNTEQQLKRHEKIAGTKYGRWTLLSRIETRKGCAWWLAECECGTIKEVNTKFLLNGDSKSCGCLKREVVIERNRNRKRN